MSDDSVLLLTSSPLDAVRARLATPTPARAGVAAPLLAAALMAVSGLSVLAVVLFGPDAPPAAAATLQDRPPEAAAPPR